jgi:hypothetical protein
MSSADNLRLFEESWMRKPIALREKYTNEMAGDFSMLETKMELTWKEISLVQLTSERPRMASSEASDSESAEMDEGSTEAAGIATRLVLISFLTCFLLQQL